jgi:hypothetical protein
VSMTPVASELLRLSGTRREGRVRRDRTDLSIGYQLSSWIASG